MEKNVQILKARGRQTMWKIFIEYDDKSKLTITGKAQGYSGRTGEQILQRICEKQRMQCHISAVSKERP